MVQLYELEELCVYFGVAVDGDTAGGHAVLREADRPLPAIVDNGLVKMLRRLVGGGSGERCARARMGRLARRSARVMQ